VRDRHYSTENAIAVPLWRGFWGGSGGRPAFPQRVAEFAADAIETFS
jgi:hypothetical protein